MAQVRAYATRAAWASPRSVKETPSPGRNASEEQKAWPRGSNPGPLRLAVIGLGASGRDGTRLSSQMEGVTLVGVSDPDPLARDLVASRYQTRSFSDYRRLVELGKPHIVLLAMPTRWHYRIASELIERRIHVLVERPLAATVEEGRELIARAQARGVKLGVAHVERFNPLITALREQLQRGTLGRVFQISAFRDTRSPVQLRDLGVVLDLASHDLPAMRYLANARVMRVSAEIVQPPNQPQEDVFCGLLRFENGVIGLLNVNWQSPTESRELVVSGQRGKLVVNYVTQELLYYESLNGNGTWHSMPLVGGNSQERLTRYPVSRREPLQLELEAFVKSVLLDEPFPAKGEEGLQSLILAQHLAEAARRGTSLTLIQDHAAPDEGYGLGGATPTANRPSPVL